MLSEYEHYSDPIGKVGVTGEVTVWLRLGGYPDALDEPDGFYALIEDQVFEKIGARLIQVGIRGNSSGLLRGFNNG
jgi:hypothetical protein